MKLATGKKDLSLRGNLRLTALQTELINNMLMSLTSNGIYTEDPGAVPGASTIRKLYMIYVRDEGQKIKNGINFYPLSSNHVGFVIRLYNNALFVRYSKLIKQTKCRLTYNI